MSNAKIYVGNLSWYVALASCTLRASVAARSGIGSSPAAALSSWRRKLRSPTSVCTRVAYIACLDAHRNTQTDDLRQHFGQFGQIVDAIVMT